MGGGKLTFFCIIKGKCDIFQQKSWQHCICDHVLNLYEVIFYSLKTISIFATVVYYSIELLDFPFYDLAFTL